MAAAVVGVIISSGRHTIGRQRNEWNFKKNETSSDVECALKAYYRRRNSSILAMFRFQTIYPVVVSFRTLSIMMHPFQNMHQLPNLT